MEIIISFFGASQSSTLDDIVTIYKSRANLIDLIKRSKVNLIFNNGYDFKSYIEIFEYESKSQGQNFEIDFKENTYSVISDGISINELAYGKTNLIGNGYIKVTNPKN